MWLLLSIAIKTDLITAERYQLNRSISYILNMKDTLIE